MKIVLYLSPTARRAEYDRSTFQVYPDKDVDYLFILWNGKAHGARYSFDQVRGIVTLDIPLAEGQFLHIEQCWKQHRFVCVQGRIERNSIVVGKPIGATP